MIDSSFLPQVEPFFLHGNAGKLFCAYQAPSGSPQGVVLFVPPFAEEMNKSRRMIAMQSRELARIGYGFLVVDLFGTGDSEGDFGDTRWHFWKDDLHKAASWLHTQFAKPTHIIGLRLGALLALDFLSTYDVEFDRIALWQPVTRGEQALTQFLRIRTAAAMAKGFQESTKDLRDRLNSGELIDVAGYEIAPELAKALDQQSLIDSPPNAKSKIGWFEVSKTGRASPASEKVLQAWPQQQIIQKIVVQGDPFWSTQEISVCPELIQQTTRFFVETKPHGFMNESRV